MKTVYLSLFTFLFLLPQIGLALAVDTPIDTEDVDTNNQVCVKESDINILTREMNNKKMTLEQQILFINNSVNCGLEDCLQGAKTGIACGGDYHCNAGSSWGGLTYTCCRCISGKYKCEDRWLTQGCLIKK